MQAPARWNGSKVVDTNTTQVLGLHSCWDNWFEIIISLESDMLDCSQKRLSFELTDCKFHGYFMPADYDNEDQ